MDRAQLAAERDRLAARHGGWRENVALGDGLLTRTDRPTQAERRTAT